MVVVCRLHRDRVPTPEGLLERICKCIGLAMCSDQVCGDMVDLSSGMPGCDRNVASPRLF